MKVNPGKDAAFHTAMKDDLRLLRYEVKSGKLSGAIALRAVVPEGSKATCDYSFVDFYPGLPPEPQSEAELTADLQKAGVDKTADQFMEELEAGATLVTTSIDHAVVGVGETKKGDYVVVNSMRVPDMGAWVRNEKKMWQPIFEDGVKSGAMAGWVVVARFMPRGAKDADIAYTVDIYPNWQSLFTFFGPDFPNRWKKIHPDVPMAEGMAQEHKMDTIEHTVLYKVVADVQK
ncbi:MAG: hypothetical protein ACRD28_01970 [Acidobacteriaceae bacterium]